MHIELTDTSLVAHIEATAKALNVTPDFVVQRILVDRYVGDCVHRAIWGQAPEQLFEFAMPDATDREFAEWLTGVRTNEERRALRDMLRRDQANGVELSEEEKAFIAINPNAGTKPEGYVDED